MTRNQWKWPFAICKQNIHAVWSRPFLFLIQSTIANNSVGAQRRSWSDFDLGYRYPHVAQVPFCTCHTFLWEIQTVVSICSMLLHAYSFNILFEIHIDMFTSLVSGIGCESFWLLLWLRHSLDFSFYFLRGIDIIYGEIPKSKLFCHSLQNGLLYK